MRQLRIALVLMVLFTVAAPMYAFAGTSGPSPIPPPANFQISAPTPLLCKGLTNIVPINITNMGNGYENPVMDDVQISLSSRYLLGSTNRGTVTTIEGVNGTTTVSTGGDSATVSSIAPNSSVTVSVPVFVSLNATNPLVVQVPIKYNYFEEYSDSEEVNITFVATTCPSQTTLAVNLTPSTLVTGEINNVTLRFTNTGNIGLNNITASLTIGSAQDMNRTAGTQFVNYKPIDIGYLPAQSSLNISEELYENNTGILPTTVSVTYFNGTELEQQSDSFTTYAGGTINMAASDVSVTPTTVSPGGLFSVSFVITDTGTSGVSNANATAITPKGFKPYGTEGYSFIGSIATQTETPISLALEANSTVASGTYTIPVVLSYENSLRQKESVTVNVPVTVSGTSSSSGSSGISGASSSSNSGSSSNAGLYVAVGTFAAVIVAIFLIARRRRLGPMKGAKHE